MYYTGMCRFIAFCLFLVSAAHAAESPNVDSRNVNIVGTKTHQVMPRYRSLALWESHKHHLREQILSAAGIYLMPQKEDLHPLIRPGVEEKDYTIEKVLIETMPGYYLGGNLYRPKDGKTTHPAILNPHGHWQYGRLENQPLYSGETLGVNLATLGFVVFAYDMVGYTDTIQTPHGFESPEFTQWSFSPLGLQLWNSIRALDFLADLPGVDAGRIGMTGASGGGTQTFLLTGVDDRIRFAAPVNMVSGIMQGGDVCENAPGLRFDTSNVEFAAMFAPKPMLIVSAMGDWTHNVPKEEFPAIQSIYQLYGKGEEVEVVQIDAPHNFNRASREAVYRFFARRVLQRNDADQIVEVPIKGHMLQELMATAGQPLPDNALTFPQVFELWKQRAGQALIAADASQRRKALALALGVSMPAVVDSAVKGNALVLSRRGEGDHIPAIYIKGKGPMTVVVDPNGAKSALNRPAIRGLLAKHRAVLVVEAFQTGGAVAPRDVTPDHFETFNRTNDQARVQDIVTAIVFAREAGSISPVLAGFGQATLWTTLAAATLPEPVQLQNEDAMSALADETKLQVPGLQRVGGMRTATELAQAGR
jgi:dienelactone hydrolase